MGRDAFQRRLMDHSLLHDFSACLLRLTKVAHVSEPSRLLQEALRIVQPLVGFRSAWWGECSAAEPGVAPRNWMHGSIQLGPEFAEEWNYLAGGDAFALASMGALGTVQRDSGNDSGEPALRAFVDRHDLQHAMAVTLELPGSGLLFFVSVYRGRDAAAFNDTEALLFTEFCNHLLLHWHACIKQHEHKAKPNGHEGFGLVDAHGQFLYLDKRLGAVLRRHHPDWAGAALPSALEDFRHSAPVTCRIGRHHLTLLPCGELLSLSLDQASAAGRLAPRERSAALLYAQGHSYKEIARLLQLSPATVRTYLRSVYLHLGVRNKVELLGALGQGS